MSTISVIIPSYNREQFIAATLDNLLQQTRPADEIIVVDDGSSDNTVAVARTFEPRGVRVFQQEHKGPGAARNLGLRNSTGKLISFFDSDDLASLNKLESQARALEENNADIAYGPWVKVFISENRVRCENVVLQQRALPPDLPLHFAIWRGWFSVFQPCLFRRSFLESAGEYREDLLPSEDVEFLFRMSLKNPRLVFTPDCLTIYRLHETNQITSHGTTRQQRVVDWANLLMLLQEQGKNLRPDFFTRILAMTELWNTHNWLRQVGAENHARAVEFRRRHPIHPSLFYRGIQFVRRVTLHVRGRLRGHRWGPLYSPGKLTQQQRTLIGAAGFTVE